MGPLSTHPPAPAAGRTALAGDAGATGGAPHDHAPLLGQAGLKFEEAGSGAVTLIQRFGSADNLNIYLHCLVLDGVYKRGTDGARTWSGRAGEIVKDFSVAMKGSANKAIVDSTIGVHSTVPEEFVTVREPVKAGAVLPVAKTST